ncbi:tripartite tricarboxylate transporter substrate binding protein [Acidovorax sp. BLS4]|uniref:Bug family tripartite tricarboxylate transporter substrate binding protein n=1 Tax=Acidovorax sp. BLS4 TaxID=3273430 RepID=UPI002942AF7C|nr:tripartite tricarboxylate transporter substrate binding protein [Paracidovorax avenae]WOI47161.1 tripartite tricarboxylate transporter substrate binding protein [Paracidovorax avenae]
MMDTHSLSRRAALGTLLCGMAGTALAQAGYPQRAITLVVPQQAGGANDAIARVVAQKLSEQLGQPVVVDNRPGAGGNVGTAAAAKARPDGYTLLLTADSAQVINPWLYQHTGFDPVKDFEPVAPLATAGYVLVANPAFPASNVAELVALAKAHPGQYAIASAGNGTLNHLIGEMLQKTAGITLQHVPYKGSAAAATDVVGGQVPLSVQSLPSSIAFIKAGKLKVLGVVNTRRVAALPDVPTIGETLAGFGQTPWYGLFAPAGTSPAVVARLQAEVTKALEQKDVAERLAAVGCEPYKGNSAQLAALVRDDLARWGRAVKDTGAKLD